MIFFIKIFLIATVLFSFSLKGKTQLLSTEGKEFWLSFMKLGPVQTSFPTMKIFLTAKDPCTASVTKMDGSFARTVSITPGAATIIDITDRSFYTEAREVISSNGLHIEASDTIGVYASNSQRDGSMDITNIIPLTALGSEYTILDYANDDRSANPFALSQFMLVGVEDNTEVEIAPTYASVNGTSNIPFTITLNKGQTYLYVSYSDLTGSTVKTKNCKKIAVFSGSPSTHIPDCRVSDNLFEQNFPTNTLGTTFLLSRSVTRGADYYKIVATQNNTKVYINNSLATILNAGGMYENYLKEPVLVCTTKPVITAFMGVGQECTSGDGDPFMVYVTPMEQAIESSSITTVFDTLYKRQFVNIHVRTIDKNQTFLDGKNIGKQFTAFPANPEYSYAQIEMTKGVHTISNAKRFTAYVYAFGYAVSYGYSAGSLLTKSDQFALVNGVSSNLQKEFYFCPPQAVSFEAVRQDTVFSQVSWEFGDGTTQSGNSVSKTFTTPGCYDVKMITTYNGSSGSCRLGTDDVISMKVCVLSNLPLSIGTDTSFCKGGSLQLSSNINPAGFSYLWSTDETTSSISVDSSGAYWLELRNGNCAVKDTVNLTVTGKPVLNLGGRQFLCINDSLLLKNSVDETGVSYTWSNGATGFSQRVNQPGVYRIQASRDGCIMEDSVLVELLTCPDIYMPNAFTPNGDGRNDVIRPIVAGLDLTYFRIYDRWGNLIFETKERLRGWDGKKGNEQQANNAYAFIVEAKDKNGKTYLKKGSFVLIR